MCAARWSEEAALAFVRELGLEPAEPYPGGAALPWSLRHLECRRISQPRLRDLVSGRSRGCRHCGWSNMSQTKQAKGQEKAYPMMLAAMLRPRVPYADIHTPWESDCLVCGAVVTPTFQGIKRGQGGCAHCAGNAPLDPEVAAEEMRSYGYEPAAQFPGVSHPWAVRCPRCGEVRTKATLDDIRRGQGACQPCGYQLRSEQILAQAAETATAAIRAARLQPLTEYPGTSEPWPCLCMDCNSESAPRLDAIRSGGGCRTCGAKRAIDARRLNSDVADAESRARGFEPVEAYTSTGTRRAHRCMNCDSAVMLTLDSIRDPQRPLCPCRATGQNLTGPHIVYVIEHPDHHAVKVGIASARRGNVRLAKHYKHGWQPFDIIRVHDRSTARRIELVVLEKAREKVSYHHYLSEDLMPQGGAWETFGEDDLSAYDMRRLVQSAAALERSQVDLPIQTLGADRTSGAPSPDGPAR